MTRARFRLLVLALACLVQSCAPADSGVSAHGPGGCGGPAHGIGRIQGTASRSSFVGQTVEVEGVATASAPERARTRGFFLQSLQFDDDERSSEALFVHLEEPRELPQRERRVRVRGRVTEHEGVTGLDAVEILSDCGRAAAAPAKVSFEQLGAAPTLEPWESMWVSSDEVWTALDTARMTSQAELTATLGNRPYASGHELGTPVADAALRIFRVRDPGALSARWTPPGPKPPALRAGARAHGLRAIVDLGWNARGLFATSPLDWQLPFVPSPVAPAPEARRIASLNVHNYFVTLGSRGAASAVELERQRQKLVAVLLALDADIVGLIELENLATASLDDLGAALNERSSPALRYAWSAALPTDTGPIRAALLYRPGRVEPLGEAWFEASPAFGRPPLFQRFALGAAELAVGVVHLKSKRCSDEEPTAALDPDRGCGEAERLAEARELVALLNAPELASSSDALMLIGDFNSDSLEAPLAELRAGGFSDLLASIPAPQRYSYVYRGRATLLDHALGAPRVARSVTRAALWHVNADEPPERDYRNEDSVGPERSSDHDPLFVDLSLPRFGRSE